MGDLVALQVGVLVLGAFLLLVGAVLLVLCAWVVVAPVVREGRTALRTGDPWAAWLPRADGSWGPLASGSRRAAFRATRIGSTTGLVVRWAFWIVMAALVVASTVLGLWGLVLLGGVLAGTAHP